MRYYTLAWFYDAQGMLLHILSLQFDHKTPHRATGPLFGGTEILSFGHNLHLHQEKRTEEFSYYSSIVRQYVPFVHEYMHEVVNGSASVTMDINLHTTELWGFLTRGEPLSKIIIRIYEIQESGQLEPFIEYTFKECWLFGHTTKIDEYQIKFTYCCCEMHFFDGNRFASHERCKATEPTQLQQNIVESKEYYAHQDYFKKQKAIEEARITPLRETQSQHTPSLHRLEVLGPATYHGKKISADGLDGFSFHIVEEPQSVDDFMKYVFKNPTQETRSNLLRMNPHIQNEFVSPAQMILLTDPSQSDYLTHELGLVEQVKQVESQRIQMQANHFEFAKNFTDLASMAHFSLGLGFVTSYFKKHSDEIMKVLTELEEGYSQRFRTDGGALHTKNFSDYRLKKFNELDSLLTKSMKTSVYGGIVGPKNVYSINAVRYAAEFDWSIRQTKVIPTISEFYKNVVDFQSTLKHVGRLAIGLGAYDTHQKINEACMIDQDACTKNKYVEWAGFWGGTISAHAVAVGAEALISAVVVSSLGIGGLAAVAIVAIPSIAAGYFAGEFFDDLSKVGVEMLYRKIQLEENFHGTDESQKMTTNHEPGRIEIELASEINSEDIR